MFYVPTSISMIAQSEINYYYLFIMLQPYYIFTVSMCCVVRGRGLTWRVWTTFSPCTTTWRDWQPWWQSGRGSCKVCTMWLYLWGRFKRKPHTLFLSQNCSLRFVDIERFPWQCLCVLVYISITVFLQNARTLSFSTWWNEDQQKYWDVSCLFTACHPQGNVYVHVCSHSATHEVMFMFMFVHIVPPTR